MKQLPLPWRKILTPEFKVRFLAFVRPGPLTECWGWAGNHSPAGYGMFKVLPARGMNAHRVMFAVIYGEGPVNRAPVVRHTCDNKGCVNPRHLLAGTYGENTQDAFERGQLTSRFGSMSNFAKLTEGQVYAIRRRRAAGQTRSAIAKDYGVSVGVVSQIHYRKTWRHLPEAP